jgi:orotate phosphoribosyltransferase
LKAEGAEIMRVVTVVDRFDGAAETFANAGLTFAPILTLKDFRS